MKVFHVKYVQDWLFSHLDNHLQMWKPNTQRYSIYNYVKHSKTPYFQTTESGTSNNLTFFLLDPWLSHFTKYQNFCTLALMPRLSKKKQKLLHEWSDRKLMRLRKCPTSPASVLWYALQCGRDWGAEEKGVLGGTQKACEIIRAFAEVFSIVRPEERSWSSQPPGSHSLTPGSGLCLRIALRQLPLRKSTRADTLNAGDAHRGRKRDTQEYIYTVINIAFWSKMWENCKCGAHNYRHYRWWKGSSRSTRCKESFQIHNYNNYIVLTLIFYTKIFCSAVILPDPNISAIHVVITVLSSGLGKKSYTK